ncbi:hypothetical protein WJX73_008895 [Symbiochloris irregularis]|uniref:protein-L-isoaspartate(D-aspartate) O-methyltransferase n=1 Tax=Symbiochloris irregularis TaxID=706552 RepID=A0AAW1P8X4_9CHLO
MQDIKGAFGAMIGSPWGTSTAPSSTAAGGSLLRSETSADAGSIKAAWGVTGSSQPSPGNALTPAARVIEDEDGGESFKSARSSKASSFSSVQSSDLDFSIGRSSNRLARVGSDSKIDLAGNMTPVSKFKMTESELGTTLESDVAGQPPSPLTFGPPCVLTTGNMSDDDSMAQLSDDGDLRFRNPPLMQEHDGMDSESGSDQDDSDAEVDAVANERARGRAALFEQIIAMQPARLLEQLAHAERRVASSNDTLVSHLTRTASLRSERVIKAMLVCRRDAFVPEDQRHGEAFADAPLPMQGMGFNMSAPHMHATCLEALMLQPGHRFLDVGSGSGVLTACAAFLVGKTGESVGVDTRKSAVKLATASVQELERSSAEYAATACSCHFERHNIFIPSAQHLGQYDRVHVGACCPQDRLQSLVALLKPSGGLIVSPVYPSSLQAILVRPNGTRKVQILGQVRYSDLEIPSDLAVVKALLHQEKKERMSVDVPPSTFAQDIAAIHGETSGSSGSEQSGFYMSTSLSGSPDTPRTPWQSRFSKFMRACSSGGTGMSAAEEAGNRVSVDSQDDRTDKPQLREGELGAPDCSLVGTGWKLPVHRVVLRARCEQFRALCNSGMRDADATEVHVPEDLPQGAVAAFVKWVYEDEVDGRMDAQGAVALLRVANFFGAPHLVGLCDLQLSRELDLSTGSNDLEGACDCAAALLSLADESNLPHLRAVALDFIVAHHSAVVTTPAYAALSKAQTDMVAAEACHLVTRMRALLNNPSAAGAAADSARAT